ASGEEIPVIGLGTSRTFEVGESAAERAPLREVLESFFASGARLIDTSPMYGTAEAVLGGLMTPDMHQRAFLATKVWTRGAREGAARVGRRARCGELGPARPQIHRSPSGGHLHHSGDGEGVAPRGQPRRRPRATARCAPARGDRAGVRVGEITRSGRAAGSRPSASGAAARSGSAGKGAAPAG